MTATAGGGGPVADSALRQLHALLVGVERLEEFLDEMVRITSAAFPPEVSCGITIQRAGRPVTAAASDARVGRFDRAQYERDRGPCLDCLRTGRPQLVPDMTKETRWGDYAAASLAEGVRSVHSLPLTPLGRDSAVGSLNLYSTAARTFDAGLRSEARAFADHASGALGVALRIAGHVEFGEDVQAAVARRSVIDQALGIVMAQQRCTADHAFEVLRRLSQKRNVKLHEVAGGIVLGLSGAGPRLTPITPRDAVPDAPR